MTFKAFLGRGIVYTIGGERGVGVHVPFHETISLLPGDGQMMFRAVSWRSPRGAGGYRSVRASRGAAEVIDRGALAALPCAEQLGVFGAELVDYKMPLLGVGVVAFGIPSVQAIVRPLDVLVQFGDRRIQFSVGGGLRAAVPPPSLPPNPLGSDPDLLSVS